MTSVAVSANTTWPTPSAVPKLAAPNAAASAVARAKAPRAIAMSVAVAMHLG